MRHFSIRKSMTVLALVTAAWASSAPALAADKLRVTSSQRGFWDTTLILWGQEQGFFKDENIDLEIVWTEGGADEVQASVSGSVDITTGTGIGGVIGAWTKGAPIRIIAAEMTGPSDLYWYVKADSPIKSLADLGGKSLAFSRPGSSTEIVGQAVVKQSGTNAKLLSTGGPAATLTQVLTNQVDAGYSAGVVNYDRIEKGEMRLLVRGSDIAALKTQTIRVHIANANFLEKNKDLVRRFLRAQQRTVDWAYKENKAVERYAEMNNVSVQTARKARDEFYPRSALVHKPVSDVELSIRQAIDAKRIDGPLTPNQVSDMLKYVNELNP